MTERLPVPLDKAYRLMNHGPTVLVSARHGEAINVMAAACEAFEATANLREQQTTPDDVCRLGAAALQVMNCEACRQIKFGL